MTTTTPTTGQPRSWLPGGRIPPPMPNEIRGLPRDERGRPIPWFVRQPEHPGGLDFRVLRDDPDRIDPMTKAIRANLCWICGTHRSPRECTFLIGPMCVVNRTTAEPPSHRQCARWAADACPFLAVPNARRRTTGLPEHIVIPGKMIERNPGVVALWHTTTFTVTPVSRRQVKAGGHPGNLIRIGDPARVDWRTQGRPATRAEAYAAVESGLPILREQAQLDGRDDVALLDREAAAAVRWLPRG